MRIYLCDLTHSGQGFTSELTPYAIGCIRSYLLDQSDSGHEVELFKEVEELNRAMEKAKPDIVGFSNYLWNINLSYAIAERIKAKYPDILIVFGGPNFPLNSDKQEEWLTKRPCIDLYVMGDGEKPFADIVDALEWHGIKDIKEKALYTYGVCRIIDGVLHKSVRELSDGTDEQCRFVDLDRIPSPYLNGSLDKFLSNPKLVPAIACNRGCPFSCTYCVAGNMSNTPIEKYPVDRVIAEINYIADRYDGHTLHIVDNNFGMFEEDVKVSKAIAEVKSRTGFPKWIIAATGKNHKHRVIEIANILTGSLRVAASVQSLDPVVLKNVKRNNIDKDALIEVAFSQGAKPYSELIMALPGGTKEEHVSGACELIDMGFDQIRLHQLILLQGSEMEANRDNYGFQTRHRILQRSYGTYQFLGDLFPVAETEEVVVGSDTFSRDDYIYCRKFGLTQALFYNERIFFELSRYLHHLGVKYSEFIKYVNEHSESFSYPIQRAYDSFAIASLNELHESEDEIHRLVKEDDYLSRDVGNNLLYNSFGSVLAGDYSFLCHDAFDMARGLLENKGIGWDEEYLSDLEFYCIMRKGYFHKPDSLDEALFHYDFVEHEKNGFNGVPERCDVTLRFFFEQWQKDLFNGQIAKYGSDARGLGKIVARTSMQDTYRKTTKVE